MSERRLAFAHLLSLILFAGALLSGAGARAGDFVTAQDVNAFAHDLANLYRPEAMGLDLEEVPLYQNAGTHYALQEWDQLGERLVRSNRNLELLQRNVDKLEKRNDKLLKSIHGQPSNETMTQELGESDADLIKSQCASQASKVNPRFDQVLPRKSTALFKTALERIDAYIGALNVELKSIMNIKIHYPPHSSARHDYKLTQNEIFAAIKKAEDFRSALLTSQSYANASFESHFQQWSEWTSKNLANSQNLLSRCMSEADANIQLGRISDQTEASVKAIRDEKGDSAEALLKQARTPANEAAK